MKREDRPQSCGSEARNPWYKGLSFLRPDVSGGTEPKTSDVVKRSEVWGMISRHWCPDWCVEKIRCTATDLRTAYIDGLIQRSARGPHSTGENGDWEDGLAPNGPTLRLEKG